MAVAGLPGAPDPDPVPGRLRLLGKAADTTSRRGCGRGSGSGRRATLPRPRAPRSRRCSTTLLARPRLLHGCAPRLACPPCRSPRVTPGSTRWSRSWWRAGWGGTRPCQRVGRDRARLRAAPTCAHRMGGEEQAEDGTVGCGGCARSTHQAHRRPAHRPRPHLMVLRGRKLQRDSADWRRTPGAGYAGAALYSRYSASCRTGCDLSRSSRRPWGRGCAPPHRPLLAHCRDNLDPTMANPCCCAGRLGRERVQSGLLPVGVGRVGREPLRPRRRGHHR